MVEARPYQKTWLSWIGLSLLTFCLCGCGDPRYDGLLDAVKDDDIQTVGDCLGKAMDARHLYGHRNTLLHFARSEEMATMLIRHGADVDAKNRRGNTPLHAAALNGFIGVARSLIDHGAAVHIANGKGQTSLFLAVTLPYEEDDFRELFLTPAGDWEAKPEIAILLMEHGADAYHKDASGKDIFQIAKARNGPEPEPIQAVSNHLAKSLRP